MRPDQVLLEPVLTEKANQLREGETRSYSFRVDPRANKLQVKKAVEELFQVTAVKCNVLWVKSKPRTTRTKSGMRQGSTGSWKKALVTLKAGDKIDAIDGV
ncbi:MAG: 50S ribosomal protein L23 [Spirochaetaceae bacterium]